jgi:membrane peptidoglycan carboxypeptidase
MKKIFKILILIIIVVIMYFLYDGYYMYKEAVNKYSIDRKIEDIRNKEEYVKKEDIPNDFINAVVSIEDNRFFSRKSVIDFKALLRATTTNIKSFSLAEGGSTITQQLAKNLYFTNEKKFSRKIAEVFLAMKLQKKYSKDEIIELYSNIVYFGEGYYGINTASKGYFKKELNELGLYEVTILAGLPNAPSAYSLNNNLDLAIKRQDMVVAAMIKYEYITYEQAAQIKKIQEEN